MTVNHKPYCTAQSERVAAAVTRSNAISVVIDASDAATADAVAESSGCCSTVGDSLQHKSSRPRAGYTLSMQLLHAT
eukprot:4302-Heterococcus_DN1.PRE.3